MPEDPGSSEILVYVHVPFCRSKCPYCGFFSLPFTAEAWKVYFQAVLQEIDCLAQEERDSTVVSLSFGGGTPSLMPLSAMSKLMDKVFSRFACSEAMEVTVEANPDSSSLEAFRALRSLGVNRLSLGLQSLSDADLHFLGRRHSAEQGVRAAQAAKEAGFDNLNLDLLFGLPGQEALSWVGQLEQALRLEPSHLSCYALTPEPGTRLLDWIRSGRAQLPEDEEQAAMFLHGAAYLNECGFEQYEISNFARSGYRCRHNLGYWHGFDYLGLGPAAVSFRKGKRRYNPKSLVEFSAGMESGQGFTSWETLSPGELANERAMLQLRLSEGLDLDAYRRQTGRNLLDGHAGFLNQLADSGLLGFSRGRIWLTRPGMVVSNAIIAELFQDC